MDSITDSQAAKSAELVAQLQQGGQAALAELFMQNRDRLRRMVRARLDDRVAGRADPSDVLQEAFLDASRQLNDYLDDPAVPPFLWLRLLTGQRLMQVHRRHLGAQMRDAKQEVSLNRGSMPQANSCSLSRQVVGRLTTPSLAAIRIEMQIRLQQLLDSLEPLDREVLSLRHFEELSNSEVALELGISTAAASKRYIRALERFRTMLAEIPGFLDG